MKIGIKTGENFNTVFSTSNQKQTQNIQAKETENNKLPTFMVYFG